MGRLMPETDPRLAALIAKFPDRTPAELYAYLHGERKTDIALPPQTSRLSALAGWNPFKKVTDALKK
jgi:hypothetical protein